MRLAATAVLCVLSVVAIAAEDIDVARQALKDGAWGAALSAADAASSNAEVRAEARLASLEALSHLGNDAEIDRRLAAWTDETDDRFRFWRLRSHVRIGDFASAEELLKTPFSDPGLALPVKFLRAYMLAEAGRRSDALDLISSEPLDGKTGPEVEDAMLLKGELLSEAGRNAEALAILRPVAEHGANAGSRLRAGYLLGFAEMAEESTRTAGVARVRSLLRSHPGERVSVQSARIFADRLLDLGDAAGADDEYRRYLEIDPSAATDFGVLSRRGHALSMLGRHSEAVGAFSRAEQSATNAEMKASAAFGQAEAFLADGHFAEAAEAYGRAAGLGGADAGRMRFAEADALERAGETSRAEGIYGDLERQGGPWGEKAGLRIAAIDARRGRIGVAIERYDGLIASNSLAEADMTEAYLGRGRACYRGYRFGEAAKDFDAVAKRNPQLSDEMRFLKALCLYGAGRDVDAKSTATSLMASTKSEALRADLTLWCAKYEYNHGRYEDARSYFLSYASLRPGGADAASALLWAARCSSALMDYSKAVELATKAADLAGTNRAFFTEALLVQGEALMELGRYAEAAQLFNRIATQSQGSPNAVKAAVLKADALYAMGAGDTNCYAEAISAYRALPDGNALSPDRRIEVAFKVGRAMEKLRNVDKAMEQYYRNVALAYSEGCAKGILFGEVARTFFVRASFALAEHYDSEGNVGAAVAMLERVVAAGVPASREAQRRIAALKRKGGSR